MWSFDFLNFIEWRIYTRKMFLIWENDFLQFFDKVLSSTDRKGKHELADELSNDVRLKKISKLHGVIL